MELLALLLEALERRGAVLVRASQSLLRFGTFERLLHLGLAPAELRAQLAAERDLGRKRDAIIARYEHWYSALKASAAARRRPSHEGSFEA